MDPQNIEKLKSMSVDQLTRYKHKIEEECQRHEENGSHYHTPEFQKHQKDIALVQKLIDKKKDLATRSASKKDKTQKRSSEMISKKKALSALDKLRKMDRKAEERRPTEELLGIEILKRLSEDEKFEVMKLLGSLKDRDAAQQVASAISDLVVNTRGTSYVGDDFPEITMEDIREIRNIVENSGAFVGEISDGLRHWVEKKKTKYTSEYGGMEIPFGMVDQIAKRKKVRMQRMAQVEMDPEDDVEEDPDLHDAWDQDENVDVVERIDLKRPRIHRTKEEDEEDWLLMGSRTKKFVKTAASNQEKKHIIKDIAGDTQMFMVGYYKKDGSFRLMKCRNKVPGFRGGEKKNHPPTHVGVYDMEAAKKLGPEKAHRTLILDMVAWALIDGVLYDFRKIPDDKLGPDNINNEPGEQVNPITPDDDDSGNDTLMARRKKRMERLSQRIDK